MRSQSLGRQADFYQSLLETNTSLTTGADFLQLINTEMQLVVNNAQGPNPSKETITAEQNAISGLTTRYNTLINQYVARSLLNQHPDQISLLAEGNHTVQVTQQTPLVGSTLRTWHVYQAAQQQTLHNIQTNNTTTAQNFWHVQGEPTNADAQSALRALILFDQRLASSIRDAASIEEQSQVLSTIIGAVIAFILIAIVGWFISNTLVQRLKQLQQITQVVEQGRLNARVPVIGRDEIADVAASFTGISKHTRAVSGLLEQTAQAVKRLSKTMTYTNAGSSTMQAAPLVSPYLEDLRTLETMFHSMTVELQHIQNNVANGFIEVDTSLTRMSTRIHVIKGKSTTKPLPQAPFKENLPDLTKQSLGFAHEVTIMARQLATLVQEMRTAIISFELDAANANNPLPLSGGNGIPQRPGMTYTEEKKRIEGIRTRNKA